MTQRYRNVLADAFLGLGHRVTIRPQFQAQVRKGECNVRLDPGDFLITQIVAFNNEPIADTESRESAMKLIAAIRTEGTGIDAIIAALP